MQTADIQLIDEQTSVAVDEQREKVIRLEAVLKGMPQAEIPVRHFFSRGVYAREMSCPAGAVITGRIHKYSQINILSKGEVSVVTDDGLLRVKAPHTFVAEPGSKRAFYVHEDAVWTTICHTNTTDIETLEDELTVGSFEEFNALALERKEGN